MMRAVDLYSGIGGWTLGMKIAGIHCVKSYEWWKDANYTHNQNFGTNNSEIDIRSLDLVSDLPSPDDVDIVVGSPPCTQFSYANRGGNGNIADGLVDIYKFLEVVNYLKPKYWAMENVPRVSKILQHELEGGSLSKFKHLVNFNQVVDASCYGVPQSRKRMIAGNFPYENFLEYQKVLKKRTLGEVIESFSRNLVQDPIYNIELSAEQLFDHNIEPHLSKEEERINRESKVYHPVYNKMSFPEQLNRPSRTITATCTRVSRESLIVPLNNNGKFRRLTVRERATLQTFPITFQFYGKSTSSKFKMIGNAIPPLLTYYIFLAMREIPAEKLKGTEKIQYFHPIPQHLPHKQASEKVGSSFSLKRRFHHALPNLRFGSGVRFDFQNIFTEKKLYWAFQYFYGNSKNQRSISLDRQLYKVISMDISKKHLSIVTELLDKIIERHNDFTALDLQKTWSHKEDVIHPFTLLNEIDGLFKEIYPMLEDYNLESSVISVHDSYVNKKIVEFSKHVFIGLLICSYLNTHLNYCSQPSKI